MRSLEIVNFCFRTEFKKQIAAFFFINLASRFIQRTIFSHREPELLSSIKHIHIREHSIMSNQTLKRISVALDPIDHKPSITGAQGTSSMSVHPVKIPHIVKSLHDILVGHSAPVPDHRVCEFLTHARRAVRIYHQHCEIRRGEKLRVPTVRPRGNERRFGTPVD
jgi:hypothetical protein